MAQQHVLTGHGNQYNNVNNINAHSRRATTINQSISRSNNWSLNNPLEPQVRHNVVPRFDRNDMRLSPQPSNHQVYGMKLSILALNNRI